MRDISKIEELFGGTFKVLDGTPQYIAIEQNKIEEYHEVKWEKRILSLVEFSQEWGLERISVLINKVSENFNDISEILLSHGFKHYSSKVEVMKDLNDINECDTAVDWFSLEDTRLSEVEYKQLWEQCMLFSDNEPSSLTMDQHINSVKSELGESWRKSCRYFYKEEKPIGITIPHIEPGTSSEGRLFYFGVLPEERGKGQSSLLHLQSLYFLKEMGATYYIGSTHIANKKMQRVFHKNGCKITSHTESYYMLLSGG